MLRSMTAYATRTDRHATGDWTWEMRGVNGKGLDLRLRLPEGMEGIEPRLRAIAAARIARGTITVTLRDTSSAAKGRPVLDAAALDAALAALAETERRADAQGITLAPATAAQILALRGLFEPGFAATDRTEPSPALLLGFEGLVDDFNAMRGTEGAALGRILGDQIDRIEGLIEAAVTSLGQRADAIGVAHHAALARVVTDVGPSDPARIAQELALIAVRLDVTEELDRLRAHVAAARDLLAAGSPVGRKLDFLSQEFMREANTLCAKSQNTGLTAVGIALKTVIDQMREQIQNVE